ncbi:MAG: hypothetical protein R3231_07310 [bacterium]|nr:hypothetical protein [bacterium]
MNLVGFHATKEGYYRSYHDYKFKEKKLGRWQPWNPTIEVVLRKVENPVPMYARNTRWSGMEIPVVGEPVGFDLTAYDWVAPYGKGGHADFIFKLEKRFVSRKDFDSKLTLTFSNPLDGIQVYKDDRKLGSDFKLPRFAPETGYLNEYTRSKKRVPGSYFEEDFEEDNNYFFRIRSEEKDGKLVRAMYGKIQGEIVFEPMGRDTAGIHFKYYHNPDYTRNMEYDPKQNLFKDLPSRERVGLK